MDIARLGWNIRPTGLRLKESLPKEKNLFRLTLAWEGKTQEKRKKKGFLNAKCSGPTSVCQRIVR